VDIGSGGGGGTMSRRSAAGYLVRHEADSESLPNPRLGRIDVELTERCNNDCIHCCICLPEGHEEARRREMSTIEVVDLLEQACDLGCLSVRFTGGEPLLRDDFEELYLAARRLGLRVLLFTNGRRLTPRLADLFARVPPLEPMEVTVYGMRERSYESVTRRRGSHGEFRRGVALLEERGVRFILKGTWLPPNYSDVDDLDDWAVGNRAMQGRLPSHSLFFELRGRRPAAVCAAGVPCAAIGARETAFWWPDPRRRSEAIRSLRPSPRDGVSFISGRDRDRYLESMRQFCNKFMGAAGDRLFTCGAGRGTCVDAYGSAQMCMPLRHPEMVVDLRSGTRGSGDSRRGARTGGKLVTGSLRRSLTEVFPRLRELRATDSDYLATCARCFLKGLCEQCPGKSWSEHGALDRRVEYLCEVAHEQARDLGLLLPGERAWEVDDPDARVSTFCGRP
jgi:MoaA/NifB/PqqE/SkfB family radical SAM enzyme